MRREFGVSSESDKARTAASRVFESSRSNTIATEIPITKNPDSSLSDKLFRAIFVPVLTTASGVNHVKITLANFCS
jgi:hypothetical protein